MVMVVMAAPYLTFYSFKHIFMHIVLFHLHGFLAVTFQIRTLRPRENLSGFPEITQLVGRGLHDTNEILSSRS